MTAIIGSSTVPADHLALWAASHGTPAVSDWGTLTALYLTEGDLEGVTGDIAFCQAIHETGWFRFGGDVHPEQNNFAGLGATGRGAKGAVFPSPQIGIRAQVQHLKAYATAEPITQAVVDPRYFYVHPGVCPNWEQLDGHWAVPGVGYGETIVGLWMEAQMETWMPGATIERGPYDAGSHGGPMTTPALGVVEHVTTSWADPGPFFARPVNQACSHFWIRADGEIVQYLPVEVCSWAQSAGNQSYWSVETDGTVDVALSSAQVSSFGRLFAWLQALPQAGFGFTLADAPGQTGLGWHGMGGASWGGHVGCPGDIRRNQRAQILGQTSPPPGGTFMTPAAQVRAWIIEFWGREPTVAEQYGGEVTLAQKGDDLTIAFLYDHAEAQAFRTKRGW